MSVSAAIDPGLVRDMLALRPGQHLCLIYEDNPIEQMPALLPFISQGLERNEQCIYIADDCTLQDLREALSAYGIDAERQEQNGALQLWTREQWRQPGELSSLSKTEQVRGMIERALADGFSGVRFCVEMTWTLGPDIDVELLRHWEATINDVFTPHTHGIIICQYSRKRLAPAVIDAALSTHPVAIVGPEVYPNPYYQAPHVFSDEGHGLCVEPSHVDWMLSQLQWARVFEKERGERERVEDALRETESSKQRIEELYALAEARGEELSKAIAAKDEFLGLVSHELRTPIATVIGNGLLLQKRAQYLQQEDKDQAIDDIVAEGQRLQRIIENLLMLTRTERPIEPHLEPVSLTHKVEENVEAFRRRTPGRDVGVLIDSNLPIVLAEPTFLSEVLDNLLSNAHKYSRPGTAIEVMVEATEAGGALICVRDDGVGIAQDELDRVFEAFYRSPGSANKARGLGLGLAVCKRVIEAMGGSIWAVARPEGGSDFIFTLQPAASSAEK